MRRLKPWDVKVKCTDVQYNEECRVGCINELICENKSHLELNWINVDELARAYENIWILSRIKVTIKVK